MATAIQVTGTGFDSNVWALVPDNDGTTCWAFCDGAFNSFEGTLQFARFSLVDGSIIHAGTCFAGTKDLINRFDESVFWAQGDNGKYYTIAGTHFSQVLYQFEIVPSAGGSTEVLDTYSTTLNSMSVSNSSSICAFTGSDGVRYVALMLIGGATMKVINADAWTLVGTYAPDGSHQPSTSISGQSVFVDKNGDLWGVSPFNELPGVVQFYHWHPADGATAGVLNVTTTEVPYSTIGFTPGNEPTYYVHYVASNHSVLLADYGPGYDSDVCNLALGTPGSPGTFTQNALRLADGSFFYNPQVGGNAPNDATDMQMTVTQPSGKLAIQSDTTGAEFNTQVGGIFNLIDPIALTSYSTLDVTQLILGTVGLPAPTQGTYSSHGTGTPWYNGFGNMVYSEVNNTLAVTYGSSDYFTGSALYLVTFAPVTPPPTPVLYQAAGGFSASAVEHKSDTSPDNMEVTHFLDADIISEDDLRAGLYDFADVELRVISYAHPEYGSLKLLKGQLGQVSMKNGISTTELRGLTQQASTVIGSSCGQGCRADLFDGKWATGDPVGDPSNHWRCRKDPTAYTYSNAVGSTPDALTIVPATALPTGSGLLPTSNNNKVTLNGVAVQAAFVSRTHSGSFDLAFSGDAGTPAGGGAGNPYIFDSGTHASIVATATGNSLVFNGAGLYKIQPVISPIDWNLLNSTGNYVSATAPWAGATENWEMMVYGQLWIPTAGHVTFTILHDDGCLFAMVPTADHPTDYVTIVSGPQTGPGTTNLNLATGPLNQKATAYNGYHFGDSWANRYVASDNRNGNRSQSWTLNFPAAGTYNFEFCFTNWEHRQQFWVTVAGQGNILPDNLSAATGVVSGWFDNGAIKITSGSLTGRVYDVQTIDTDGNIKLFGGAPLPVGLAPGDTFLIQAGCNKLTTDCKFKFDNVINHQGENQMPGNLVILATPDTH